MPRNKSRQSHKPPHFSATYDETKPDTFIFLDNVPNITTYEKKTGFLLIEVFSKGFNPQNYGHLDLFRVAIYYCQEFQ